MAENIQATRARCFKSAEEQTRLLQAIRVDYCQHGDSRARALDNLYLRCSSHLMIQYQGRVRGASDIEAEGAAAAVIFSFIKKVCHPSTPFVADGEDAIERYMRSATSWRAQSALRSLYTREAQATEQLDDHHFRLDDEGEIPLAIPSGELDADMEECLRKLLAQMSADELLVLEALSEGKTQREIATLANRSTGWANSRVKGVKSKFDRLYQELC